jgi:ankyrin repeat protein
VSFKSSLTYILTTIAAVLLVGCGGPSVDIWETAKEGNIESVKQYLNAGGDVDAKTEQGFTPLFSAALDGHKEVAKLLIAKGSDVNVRGFGEMTPLNMAVGEGQKEIADFLRKRQYYGSYYWEIYIVANNRVMVLE